MIVEAVGVAARSTIPGLGKWIQAAMADAAAHCQANGITDPSEIRAAMMRARALAKSVWRGDLGITKET